MGELRLSARRLLRQPVSTLASALTLASAVAAAAVAWAVLSAVFLRPFPFTDLQNLVFVGVHQAQGRDAGSLDAGLVYPYFAHLRKSGVFEGVAAAWGRHRSMALQSGPTGPHTATVGFLSHNFFQVTGVAVVRGRGFAVDDDRRGAAPVAIISHRYWKRHWASAPDVVGKSIVIKGLVIPIIGVAPPKFVGLDLSEPADIFLPLDTIGTAGAGMNYFADPAHEHPPSPHLRLIARLLPQTTAASVNERLSTLGGPPAQERPRSIRVAQLASLAIPTRERALTASFGQVMGATVGILIVLGCITVGMLLLIRTEARRGELAVCRALGASPARLTAGIVAEGCLMSLGGAVAAIPLALALLAVLGQFRLPGGIAIESLELSVDASFVSAASVVALFTTLLISAAAGLFGWRAQARHGVNAAPGATPRVGRNMTRKSLVSLQISAAVLLAVGAGVLARSVVSALAMNEHLDAERILVGGEHLPAYGYDERRAKALFDEFGAQVTRVSGVVSISFQAFRDPIVGSLRVDGISIPLSTVVASLAVDSAYFATLDVPLRAGRPFSGMDDERAPRVGIVSESLAKAIATTRNPIGARIGSGRRTTGHEVEIVGIVPDVVQRVTDPQPLVLYVPMAQTPPSARQDFIIHVSNDVALVRGELRRILTSLDPAIVPRPVYTLDERIGDQMHAQRFGVTVLGALAAIALLLTLLGTYVLAETMVTTRLREIGIRAALGATRPQLASLVLRDTGQLVCAGVAGGLVLAWLSGAALQSFVFGVQPLDPVTLAAVSGSVLLLASAASARAAWRAASVNVASMLKGELQRRAE